MRKLPLILAALSFLSACALTKQEASVDLTAAYNVAAAAEVAYAAQPSANPAKVAQAQKLLAAAQAALLTWSNSSSPTDQTAANAAIAALVAYEATATSQPTAAQAAH